jgi:MFS family permease
MASDQTVDAATSGGPDLSVVEPELAAAKVRDSVLANADFVKLWGGESISLIGTQITQFAMPLVAVLTLRATVFEVGMLNALRFAPVLVASLFAGVWLDRRRRRPVLIACALGNALLIGLVPIASVAGILSIGLLYVVTTLAGLLSMTFDIGALSYVPNLVASRHLAEANGRLQASEAIAGIGGPGLAGLLVGLVTAPIALSADAVSYLFSATGLVLIRKPEPAPELPEEGVSLHQSIAEGLRTVYGSRMLRSLLTQSAALNLAFGAAITVFVVYAIRYLGLTPLELGVAMATVAVGGLIGAMTIRRIRTRLGLGRSMLLATLGLSLPPLALMVVPRGASVLSLTILLTAQFLYGTGVAMYNVNAITMRQAVTPRRLLARMNASYRLLLFGAPVFGAFIGGLLGTAVGLRDALIISVIAMSSPLLWIFTGPVFRLREMPLGLHDDEASPQEMDPHE